MPTPTEQKRVVFLHVAKTAGTSLRNALSAVFPPQTICPELYDGLKKYTIADLANFRLFAGHFTHSSLTHIPGEFDVITMLREPGARLLSFYYFMQSHKIAFLEQYFPDYVAMKCMSLDDYLSRGAPGFMSAVDQIGDGDMFLAKKRLRKMKAIGLAEQSDLSRRVIAWRLGIELPALPRLMVTGKERDENIYEPAPPVREPLTDRQQSELANITRSDRALWRFARRRFHRDVGVFRMQRFVSRILRRRPPLFIA